MLQQGSYDEASQHQSAKPRACARACGVGAAERGGVTERVGVVERGGIELHAGVERTDEVAGYLVGVEPAIGVVERIKPATDDGVGVILRPDVVVDEVATGGLVSVLLWTGVVERLVCFSVTPCCRPIGVGADADCPKDFGWPG